jgi:Clr5 domain
MSLDMEPSIVHLATGVRRAPTPAQWSECRDRFTRLYLIEGKTLKETMAILEQEYALRAT